MAAAHGTTGSELAAHGLSTKPFSLYVRLRDPAGDRDAPFFACHSADGVPVCRLFASGAEDSVEIVFELSTDWHARPLRLNAPFRFAPAEWHDLIVRYSGPKLELFLDGVLVDEEWPIGTPRLTSPSQCLIGVDLQSGGAESGVHSPTHRAALWQRALSDGEVAALSGGKEHIARRERRALGEEPPTLQYWKPRGHNAFAGDCMPFFHAGRFHLFYLFDRRHHRSKWGLGAHQWAHLSSTDLRHWEHHPLAIPITEEWEGSICTGSAFEHDGTIYGFYATRMIDGSPAPLQAAVSVDGVHFAKTASLAVLGPPYLPGPARDPKVFRDEQTGLFHMLVTTELEHPPAAQHGGCLAHLTSTDLKHWEQGAPFIIPGYSDQPECPDHFFWHGWYYLVFSNGGVARYRMSRSPLGPWRRPKNDAFDGPQLRVLKTAAFTGDRRIGVGFLPLEGWAGHVVFREMVQHDDGALGTRFPPEMAPLGGESLRPRCEALTPGVENDSDQVRISAWEGLGIAALADIPRDMRLTCRVVPEPGSSCFGLCLRGAGDYRDGHELRFEPARGKAGWRRPASGSIEENEMASLYHVDGLDRPFTLDVIAKGDILDVCIDERRTLVVRAAPDVDGDRLFLFAHNGEVRFETLDVKPLL